MNILLSIKPQYTNAILNGIKKYEFRRSIFKREDIDQIYIYSTSNLRKIVGSFGIEKILEETPDEIWKKCNKQGGISKEDFFKYFKGTKKAYAIKIKNVNKFNESIDPYVLNDNFRPPQSFYYTPFKFEQLLINRRG